MQKIINVFSRHEIKYLVTSEQRKIINEAIKEHMIPDTHGMSTICNVYYDTPDFRLIRRSQEKPNYKEKIRVRSYGTPNEKDVVFLELKKKFDGVVYKRRIELPEKIVESYMKNEVSLSEIIDIIKNQNKNAPADAEKGNPQIAKEIDYFKSFYKNLKPAVYLSYDRCAFFSSEDTSLRITFDKNICWRQTYVRLTEKPGGYHLLEEGTSLMEIKTATALPIWLVDALSEAEARPASFSKYGHAYETILRRMLEEGGRLAGIKETMVEDFKAQGRSISTVTEEVSNKPSNKESVDNRKTVSSPKVIPMPGMAYGPQGMGRVRAV